LRIEVEIQKNCVELGVELLTNLLSQISRLIWSEERFRRFYGARCL